MTRLDSLPCIREFDAHAALQRTPPAAPQITPADVEALTAAMQSARAIRRERFLLATYGERA